MSEVTPQPIVQARSEHPGAMAQAIAIRTHSFRADGSVAHGGSDSAPGAHDYFDAALAACKAMTATWFARLHNLPLEEVHVQIARDDSEERKGTYKLNVQVDYIGPLNDDERKRLHAAVARCPVHKLMTSSAVVIETAPLAISHEAEAVAFSP